MDLFNRIYFSSLESVCRILRLSFWIWKISIQCCFCFCFVFSPISIEILIRTYFPIALVINLGVHLCFQSWPIKCFTAFLLRITTKVVEYLLEGMETNKMVKKESNSGRREVYPVFMAAFAPQFFFCFLFVDFWWYNWVAEKLLQSWRTKFKSSHSKRGHIKFPTFDWDTQGLHSWSKGAIKIVQLCMGWIPPWMKMLQVYQRQM